MNVESVLGYTGTDGTSAPTVLCWAIPGTDEDVRANGSVLGCPGTDGDVRANINLT